MADLGALEQEIGYCFTRSALLEEAMTHPSYTAELQYGPLPHNQRLEFLGDAVLQLIITDCLFRRFEDLHEGKLTKLRAILTRKATLADFGRRLALGNYLQLGHGEESTGGRERASNLCDAFEALLGAIYMDCGGLEAPAALVDKLAGEMYPDLLALLAADNPKGVLQEYLQKSGLGKPSYQVLSETGPDHDKRFRVAVLVGEQCMGEGIGRKRQGAEQAAAREALRRLDADA